MLLLAIDTAGPDCAVALARSDGSGVDLVYRMANRIGRGHAEQLIPMIDAALGSAGLAYPDLDRIAVTTGPGSFTGVRVGVAAARALSLALDVPAVGVGSLHALVFGARRERQRGPVAAVLDAKRGQIYAYAQDGTSGAVLLEASVAPAGEIAARVRDWTGPVILTGAGAPLLAAELPGQEIEITGTAEAPDIGDVALLGLEAEPAGRPVPLYLRGADAKPQDSKAVARL